MKIINSTLHGFIDYLVVLFLWLSPSLFGMEHFTAMFTYGLGAIHLVLTLTTNYKAGLIKLIPLPVHGWIELLVGVALIILAFTLFSADPVGKIFYLVFGAVVLLTALISDYNPAAVKI